MSNAPFFFQHEPPLTTLPPLEIRRCNSRLAPLVDMSNPESHQKSIPSPLLTPILLPTSSAYNISDTWDNLGFIDITHPYCDPSQQTAKFQGSTTTSEDWCLSTSPSSSVTTTATPEGYMCSFVDDFAALEDVFPEVNQTTPTQLPDISKLIPTSGYLKTIPPPAQPALDKSALSKDPGNMSTTARNHSCCSYSCTQEVLGEMLSSSVSVASTSSIQELHTGADKLESGCSSVVDPCSYDERVARRKDRNNAASRKSRALRKHRFQEMLNEAEILVSSNAKMRCFLGELNTILSEAQALLIERVGNSSCSGSAVERNSGISGASSCSVVVADDVNMAPQSSEPINTSAISGQDRHLQP